MAGFRRFPGGDNLGLVERKATEIGGKAAASSHATGVCYRQSLSFLASASELDKIRQLTIAEAILMFVLPEKGIQ